MGKELTVRPDAPAQEPPRPAARPVDRVVWRESAPARAEAPAELAAPPPPPAVVDVAWSQSAVDPEQLIATLRAERAAAHGGYDHPHTPAGCVFCRRAAAAYR